MGLGEHQSFDAFASSYDEYCTATTAPVLPWLEAHGVRLGGRAVDLGCGSGRHSLELSGAFAEVVGVDVSEPLLDIARSRRAAPNIQYLLGDLTHFEDPLGFDLVFSSTALHHVPDLPEALTRIRHLVRPGGWVVLSDTVRVASGLHRWLWSHGGVYVGPLADVRRHIVDHGIRRASRLLRFQVSRRWIRHLLADRWLTIGEFERCYLTAFPGGTITRRAGLATLVWHDDATGGRGDAV